MSFIWIILFVALMIPIMGIIVDSPIGRALARRLEGPDRGPVPELAELAKKVELLEGEVDDLTVTVQRLREENQFFQQFLEDPTRRSTLPSPPSSSPPPP